MPIVGKGGSEIQWEYTLNTLVDRVMDQDALPALLASYYLTKDTTHASVMHGVEVMPENQTEAEAEFDFLIVRDQSIWGGECKAGTRLTQKDIERGKLAAKLGFLRFYYCTVQEFDPESIRLVEALYSEIKSAGTNMSVKVLTKPDLLA